MPTYFAQLVRERYSVRKFDPHPVGEEKIHTILTAAQLAPSAKNGQSWRVLVLNEPDVLARLMECTPCHYHAPLAFLVCYDRSAGYRREYDGAVSGPYDAAIAATHIMLQAWELGLGSTWVMNFDPEMLCTRFSIPESICPAALLVCGYPQAGARPSQRHKTTRPLSELCFFNRFPSQEGTAVGE